MKRLLPFFAVVLLLIATASLGAQRTTYTTVADSDPAAVTLLEKIRTKYDGYTTMTAEFKLDIALPNQPVETQKGSIKRQGDNVRFKLGNQEGIINERAAYVILHGSKEVQINDLPEPGETTGVLTPQTLFNFYEGDAYVLALQGRESFNGRSLQSIELKPVERDNSDFSKLRLLVDDERGELVNVRAFSRDGSQYTFTLDKTEANPSLETGTFVFDKDEFPGYYVEDLRY